MYSIKKEFHFSSSHVLRGLSDDHPCSRLHGHNYVVILELEDASVDAIGMVLDYRRLSAFNMMLQQKFDHQHLNDRMDQNPTAENMCKLIFDMAVESIPMPIVVKSVTVKETPKTEAKYYVRG